MPWSSGSAGRPGRCRRGGPRPGAGVEHQVAHACSLVRADPQQDQRADVRVCDLRVGEGLQRLVDGLAVDALAGLGVVLDLDGEVAADGLDEDLALDRDVRVAARDVVARGSAGSTRSRGGRERRGRARRGRRCRWRCRRPSPPAQHPRRRRLRRRSGRPRATALGARAAAAAGPPGSSGRARRSRAEAGRRPAAGPGACVRSPVDRRPAARTCARRGRPRLSSRFSPMNTL